LTEGEFSEIWKKSWARNTWSNKERHIKGKIIAPTRIEKIRHGLNMLLYGSEDFVSRYDRFLENVARFGDLQQSIKKDTSVIFNKKIVSYQKLS
jgi:predicted sulfurtransferase